MSQANLPRLLSGPEVLKLLGIENKSPHGTLHRLRRKGLPHVRFGRAFVYPEDAVAKFILASVA